MPSPERLPSHGGLSLEILYRLFEAMRDGAILADAKGRIRYVNEAAQKMFGYAPEELLGQPVATLDVTKLPLGSDEAFERAITAKGVWDGYSAGRTREGDTFPVTITIVPLGTEDTQPWGYAVIYHDARESMQELEDLRATIYLAKSAGHVRRQIINAITHEFRTPLATLLGFADLLRHMEDLPGDAREFAEAICQSAERLSELVESVVEYASLQAGHPIVHPEPYDLRTRLQEISSRMEERLQPKGLRWEFSVDPAMPEYIMVDGEKLERILQILLDNAEKFTRSGKISLNVTRSPLTPDMVDFRVEDTGVGYDPALSEEIFEPFRQGEEGLNRRFSGIGLGLALAKELSELLGGSLRGASKPGHGSTFVLTIPIKPAHASADQR